MPDAQTVTEPNTTPTPTDAPTPSPADERAKLRQSIADKLADLAQQLEQAVGTVNALHGAKQAYNIMLAELADVKPAAPPAN